MNTVICHTKINFNVTHVYRELSAIWPCGHGCGALRPCEKDMVSESRATNVSYVTEKNNNFRATIMSCDMPIDSKLHEICENPLSILSSPLLMTRPDLFGRSC